MAVKKAQQEEDRLKGLTPKEREEWKRSVARPSGKVQDLVKCFSLASTLTMCSLGRQLFERNKNLEDETLMEEGAVSVDISQYDRTNQEEEEQEEGLTFSDSD